MKKIIVLLVALILLACSGDISAQQTQPQVGGSSWNFSPNLPSFAINETGTIAPSYGIWTKIPLNTVVFDTNSSFDHVTNYRHVPSIPGKYLYTGLVCVRTGTTLVDMAGDVFKNGSANPYGNVNFLGTFTPNTWNCFSISVIYSMNGSTDYAELYVKMGGTGSTLAHGNMMGARIAN